MEILQNNRHLIASLLAAATASRDRQIISGDHSHGKEFLGEDDIDNMFLSPFNVVELGAGDGTKTSVLLEYFLEKNLDFTYSPIDISEGALLSLISFLQVSYYKHF